jgi:hypothetical protein
MNNNSSNEAIKENIPVRAQDLLTRERVNFVIDSELMSKLRQFSKEKNCPMSRSVDQAIRLYLNNYDASDDTDTIALYHNLELFINSSVESEICKTIFMEIDRLNLRYIFSSCLLHINENATKLGTKIQLYLSDSNNEAFTELINYISTKNSDIIAKVFLDKTELR